MEPTFKIDDKQQTNTSNNTSKTTVKKEDSTDTTATMTTTTPSWKETYKINVKERIHRATTNRARTPVIWLSSTTFNTTQHDLQFTKDRRLRELAEL